MLLFLYEKNQNLLDIQEHLFANWEKYEYLQSEPKLLFGVYYWFLKLYTRIIWHSYFPLHGNSGGRAATRLGLSGLIVCVCLHCSVIMFCFFTICILSPMLELNCLLECLSLWNSSDLKGKFHVHFYTFIVNNKVLLCPNLTQFLLCHSSPEKSVMCLQRSTTTATKFTTSLKIPF